MQREKTTAAPAAAPDPPAAALLLSIVGASPCVCVCDHRQSLPSCRRRERGGVQRLSNLPPELLQPLLITVFIRVSSRPSHQSSSRDPAPAAVCLKAITAAGEKQQSSDDGSKTDGSHSRHSLPRLSCVPRPDVESRRESSARSTSFTHPHLSSASPSSLDRKAEARGSRWGRLPRTKERGTDCCSCCH